MRKIINGSDPDQVPLQFGFDRERPMAGLRPPSPSSASGEAEVAWLSSARGYS